MSEQKEIVTLTSDVVRHVAKLSRLALTDAEIDQTKIDLVRIFTHIDRLKEVDTKGIVPLDHPTELLNRDRNDTVGTTLTQHEVLENAPATKGVYIDVPKVLGSQS